MKKGRLNKISDVNGISVGHYTMDEGRLQTGITVINPSIENPFLNKLQAASYIINGYGKSTGLLQIDELGLLESPIALTNTLSVGRVQDFLIEHIIDSCKNEESLPASINAVVCECNDAKLNDIKNRKLEKKHLDMAFNNACEDFDLGAVGSGRGMVCYGLKGGIGSSSRIVEYNHANYTIGSLVMTNHGLTRQLNLYGNKIGLEIEEKLNSLKNEENFINKKNAVNKDEQELEKGSIIVIVATDAPLDSRQLKRVAKRAGYGISRTGSEFGNGSGDIVIAFSTANKVRHFDKKNEATELLDYQFINDMLIDKIFTATIESVEESIISSLLNSDGLGEIKSLKEFI